jgi:nitrogen fixation/metabolism regulation signal transduction histidine kinase
MAANRQFVRKHFFIDRKLQGRYMVTFLIPMLILLVFMLFTLYFAAQTIVSTTSATIKENIQDKITSQLQDVANPTVERYEGLLSEIDNYLRNFSTSEKYRQALLSSLMWVFGAGIFLVIIQIALLTIFFSHKLAGPVYRFEKACHAVIEGNYSQNIILRRGDDLQNLAVLFNHAMEATRNRFSALVNACDEAERKKIAQTISLQSGENYS